MKKIIFASLFFLAAAPLLLFQETSTVFKNNKKFLRGELKNEGEKGRRIEGEKREDRGQPGVGTRFIASSELKASKPGV